MFKPNLFPTRRKVTDSIMASLTGAFDYDTSTRDISGVVLHGLKQLPALGDLALTTQEFDVEKTAYLLNLEEYLSFAAGVGYAKKHNQKLDFKNLYDLFATFNHRYIPVMKNNLNNAIEMTSEEMKKAPKLRKEERLLMTKEQANVVGMKGRDALVRDNLNPYDNGLIARLMLVPEDDQKQLCYEVSKVSEAYTPIPQRNLRVGFSVADVNKTLEKHPRVVKTPDVPLKEKDRQLALKL